MRGGRRPGAGAPKGNLNAFRSGNKSKRARIILNKMLALTDAERIPVARALDAAGFLDVPLLPRSRIPAAVAFLWSYFFDRPPAPINQINQTQVQLFDRPETPINQFNQPSEPEPAAPPSAHSFKRDPGGENGEKKQLPINPPPVN